MSHEDYTTSFTVTQTPDEVFAAIKNVRGWWSGEIVGTTDELDAEFTYTYQDVHRSVQKIIELIPGKKVVWHVTDAYLSFVENKEEWKDTDIIFEISEQQGHTEVRFTHRGLVPTYACYGNCSGAWQTLINDNLRNLIVTGQSQGNAFAKA